MELKPGSQEHVHILMIHTLCTGTAACPCSQQGAEDDTKDSPWPTVLCLVLKSGGVAGRRGHSFEKSTSIYLMYLEITGIGKNISTEAIISPSLAMKSDGSWRHNWAVRFHQNVSLFYRKSQVNHWNSFGQNKRFAAWSPVSTTPKKIVPVQLYQGRSGKHGLSNPDIHQLASAAFRGTGVATSYA